jgi:hypothetical protein
MKELEVNRVTLIEEDENNDIVDSIKDDKNEKKKLDKKSKNFKNRRGTINPASISSKKLITKK